MLLLYGVLGVGCLPAAHPLEGTRCTDAGQCPSVLVCDPLQGGLCLAPEHATSFLTTWDFEQNDLGWRTYDASCGGCVGRTFLTREDLAAHGGQYSVRVQTDGGNTQGYSGIRLVNTALPAQPGQALCADAWVNAVHADLGVLFRARISRIDSTGQSFLFDSDVNDQTADKVGAPTHGWARVLIDVAEDPSDPAFQIDGGSPVVSLRFSSSPASLDFFVDDVRVWVRPDGGCR